MDKAVVGAAAGGASRFKPAWRKDADNCATTPIDADASGARCGDGGAACEAP